MSIQGQGNFFTIYFSGFVCFVLDLAKISGERLQDHWSSGIIHTCVYRTSYFSAIYHIEVLHCHSVKKKTIHCPGTGTIRTKILNSILEWVTTIIEPRCEKTGLRGFHQVRHKPGCTATEDG